MAVSNFEDTSVPPRKRTQNAASIHSIGYKFNANYHAKCDSCRRRKTKCNGKLPCHACSSHRLSLECSYRSKVKGSGETEHLVHPNGTFQTPEAQVAYSDAKAEPVSLNSPISHSEQRSKTLRATRILTPQNSLTETASANPYSDGQSLVAPSDYSTFHGRAIPCDSQYMDTYSTTSRRAPGEAKQYAYGSWGGMEILRRMRADLDVMAGIPSSHSLAFVLTDALDQPHSLETLPIAPANGLFSPKKESLISRVENAFNGVLSFWLFLEKSGIEKVIERVYDPKSTSGLMTGQDDMALVYAVAALGGHSGNSCIWDVGVPLSGVRWEGLEYFQTAQRIVDPADCARSLTAVQVIMTMAIFLISRSSITMAHRLVSNATTAAIQLDLHQRFYAKGFSEFDMHGRRRTYQSLRALDTHVCHFLGLPACLPATKGGFENSQRWLDESYEHMVLGVKIDAEQLVADSLLNILASAQQKAYSSGLELSYNGAHYIPTSVVRDCIRDFLAWKNLQRHFHTKGLLNDSSASYLAETTAQMMVFSPFLHYIFCKPSIEVQDGYAAGLRCIEAATKHIGIIEQLSNEKLPLAGCFSLTFGLVFAAMALLMMEAAGAAGPVGNQIQETNMIAQRVLQRLSLRSEVILTCYESLQPLYTITNSFGWNPGVI